MTAAIFWVSQRTGSFSASATARCVRKGAGNCRGAVRVLTVLQQDVFHRLRIAERGYLGGTRLAVAIEDGDLRRPVPDGSLLGVLAFGRDGLGIYHLDTVAASINLSHCHAVPPCVPMQTAAENVSQRACRHSAAPGSPRPAATRTPECQAHWPCFIQLFFGARRRRWRWRRQRRQRRGGRVPSRWCSGCPILPLGNLTPAAKSSRMSVATRATRNLSRRLGTQLNGILWLGRCLHYASRASEPKLSHSPRGPWRLDGVPAGSDGVPVGSAGPRPC